MLPSTQQCYQLWDKYNLPQKKRIHSQIISDTALFMGKKLKEKGTTVSLRLLMAACLLHDIDKNVPKKAGEKHPESAVRVLKQERLDEVAEIVRTHSLHCILDPEYVPQTWEQKLLYLSDKMVKYELIGVDRRFQLWRDERLSGRVVDELDQAYPKVKALKKEIFNLCNISFADIQQFVCKE